MKQYIVLLRGINVGGKNKLPMAELRNCLQAAGFRDVSTYIASGNAIISSDAAAATVQATIENILPTKFKLDSRLVKVLVMTPRRLQSIVDARPAGFGEQPDTFHSDVIFLMGIPTAEALTVFKPRQGVDMVWPGKGVIYSQRLSAERTKSRLSAIVGTLPYQSMTIRNWNTTLKLLSLTKN